MTKVAISTQQFVSALRVFISDHVKSERGATAVEYGLLVALIAIVAAVGFALLGSDLKSLFTNVGNEVS